MFYLCITCRNQIYIAPSGVQKERIQVSRIPPKFEAVLGTDNDSQLQMSDMNKLEKYVTVSVKLFKILLVFFWFCFQPEDMFVCDMEGRDICSPPAWKKLKKSQCTPLFMNAYTMRG